MFAEGGRHEQEITVVGDRAKVETTFPGDRVLIGPRDGSGRARGPRPCRGPLHGFPRRLVVHRARSVHRLRARRSCPEVTVDDGLWSVAMGSPRTALARGTTGELEELGLRPAASMRAEASERSSRLI